MKISLMVHCSNGAMSGNERLMSRRVREDPVAVPVQAGRHDAGRPCVCAYGRQNTGEFHGSALLPAV